PSTPYPSRYSRIISTDRSRRRRAVKRQAGHIVSLCFRVWTYTVRRFRRISRVGTHPRRSASAFMRQGNPSHYARPSGCHGAADFAFEGFEELVQLRRGNALEHPLPHRSEHSPHLSLAGV